VALRFIGIGAPKCATTWTFDLLKHHPDVQFPAGKEVNFWSDPKARGGFEWYRDVMQDGDLGVVAGEISVEYGRLPAEKIREMRRRYPDVRLFLHVRHPIDRAWSMARMRIREAQLDVADMTEGELMKYIFVPGNIENGDYASTMDRWLAVFPAEQMLISRYDDIEGDAAGSLARVCTHIGVDFTPLAGRRHGLTIGRRYADDRPIPSGIRSVLERLYAEPMARFLDEYGIDYTGPGEA